MKLRFLEYIKFIRLLKSLIFHIDFLLNLVSYNGVLLFTKKNIYIKILPRNIENLLTNFLSSAVWFMDDSGKGRLHGIIISVHNFTNNEVKL